MTMTMTDGHQKNSSRTSFAQKIKSTRRMIGLVILDPFFEKHRLPR